MDRVPFREEAENCRREAIRYLGKPEAPFLLRLAEAFEELHVEQRAFEVRDHKAEVPRAQRTTVQSASQIQMLAKAESRMAPTVDNSFL